ncbi:hypothetical protein BV20DRAFT_963270 [Pilatotrama ljubarskyi]|nr:hypothetical protein BV20DRAFT_963270 [Pilatotrama ljubarskyi]
MGPRPYRWKTRRCNYYKDNGQPRRLRRGILGCPNGLHCEFVHPEDSGWEDAPSSHPPPLSLVYPDSPEPSSDAPVPPPSTSARPPSPCGPPRPPPRDPPLRERVPSTGADRDFDERIASRPQHPRAPSPAPSIASSSGSRMPRTTYVASGARRPSEDRERDDKRPDERRYRDDDRRRAEDRRYEDRSRERDRRRDEDRYRDDDHRRDGDRRRDRRSRSGSRTRRPSTSAHPPSRPSDMYDRDSQRRTSPPPPRKELTPEEKRKLWLDRIKLLSGAVQARSEHIRLHEDLQRYERLTKSTQYENLPEEDKAALQKLIAATTSRFQEKQQELNRIAGQLIPEDFWPFAQRAQQAADPGFQMMTEVLASVKRDVQELHGSLASVHTSLPSAAATAVPSGPTPAPKPEPGEITGNTTTRPKKRRRLSTDQGGDIAALSSSELEKMQDRLAALTHRISDLQNDLLQYDSRVADEVEAQLDYRMAGLRLGVGGEAEPLADPEAQRRVEQLAQDVALAQSRTAEAEAELAKLQSYGQTRDEKNTSMQKENDALRKQIDELQANHAEMTKLVNEQRTEIGALNAAVTAHISRPPNPPLPPGPLTADAIIEAIKPRLLLAARDDLVPILEEVRAHVEKQLQEQSSQVSGELMAQMGPVVRSVEWISAWIERIRGPNGAPNPATSTAATSAAVDKGKGVAR